MSVKTGPEFAIVQAVRSTDDSAVYLAHGETTATILSEFPSLTEEDVRAVIAFTAASASEDLPAPSPIPPDVRVA